jgi:hypothetical protein
MASTVKLPVFGQVNKGTVVGVTIGGLAVSAFMIYRHQKKAQEAAAAVATTDAEGYGYGYGTPANALVAANSYGYGSSGGFYPTGYYGYGTPTPGSGGAQPGVPATTNAQWDQAAITQLGGSGYSPQNVTKVLGEYLAGAEVAPGDVHIVDAAIGIEGYPPDSGANGFPPGIKTGGTTGGGQGSKVTVPHVKGLRGARARQLLTEAGLKDHQVPEHVKEGDNAIVTSQSPIAGRKVNSGSTVTVRLKITK